MNRIPHSGQTKIKNVLDQAITTVAEQEFNRLRNGLSDAQVAERVIEALESMGELQRGGKPEYSEWDALFYVTWYQPRQINVALTILRHLNEITRNGNLRIKHPLHIIDVGCGALAAQFALAIALAEYQAENIDVSMQGIDPSDPMKQIGENLWLEFWSIIDGNPDLSYLSRTCDLMTDNYTFFDSSESYYRSEDVRLSGVQSDSKCWLMAIHTVYESNKQSIKDTLQTISDKSCPEVIMVTTHVSKCGAAGFAVGAGFKNYELKSEELLLQGNLPETTIWRKHLIQRLPENSLKFVRGLLENPVQWNPSNHHTVVYRKEFKS